MAKSKKQLGEIIRSNSSPQHRMLVGVPMTGLLRAEWVMARYGQVTPCNWSMGDATVWLDQSSPLRFSVADARNIIADRLIRDNFEWLFFIDHDVVLPQGILLKINEYMRSAKYPIVNGLYFTRSFPSEPLIYRKLGHSFYDKWFLGDKVWAGGAGLGCTLIHGSIIRAVATESEEYLVQGMRVRRVFHTPAEMKFNEEKGAWESHVGTEDLHFYSRLKRDGFYTKAGWPEFQKKEWPLLIDTGMFCRHIDQSGKMYPMHGEEAQFIRPNKRKEYIRGLELRYGIREQDKKVYKPV